MQQPKWSNCSGGFYKTLRPNWEVVAVDPEMTAAKISSSASPLPAGAKDARPVHLGIFCVSVREHHLPTSTCTLPSLGQFSLPGPVSENLQPVCLKLAPTLHFPGVI